MRHQHTCVRCGNTFTSKAPIQKFCSLACAGINRGVRVDWRCEACGKQDQRVPYKAKERFCSVACRGVGRRKGSERICAGCKRPFIVQPHRASAIYCCRACMDAVIMNRTEKKCEVCGKTYAVARHQDRSRYCSRACSYVGANTRVTLDCVVCRKPFSVQFNRRETAMCCSRNCRYKYDGETIPERRVRLSLGVLSVEFLCQHPVRSPRGRKRYHLDFYLPAMNTALEVDGLYWHAGRADHDTKRDAFLQKQGIRTVRVSDTDIMAATCVPSLIASRLGIKWQGQMALPL